MSKIFDALQRSENERVGSTSATLPQGPELLREAERRAATTWHTVGVQDSDEAISSELERSFSPQLVPESLAKFAAPNANELVDAGARLELLSQCAPLPISLSPGSHLATLSDSKSASAEAVRLLTVRLRDFRRKQVLKKVVITSTIPQEGKSTIAANLACALARRKEERVLLIEGDIRIPSVLKMFGIDPKQGLCELLRSRTSLTDCIYQLPDAGIWVLPAGIATSNPLELLQSQAFSSVIEQISACFDWVIIDTPPVLPLADTSIWMRVADGVLLVTRQGVTRKKQLKLGLEALEPQKVLGAILNSSKASAYSAYYYGDSNHS